jgi:hypothetical protein
MMAFKYEDSSLAFPVGARNNYLDYNGQLKITTQLSQNLRLQVNGLYAKIESVSGSSFSNYGGALQGASNSFGYLNSTEPSISSAASLIGGASFNQIFNKSRLQFYDQRLFTGGGTRLTHSVSDKTFLYSRI